MATNLDYQKAKRVRSTSLADLLSDQLATSPTIRGAIGKTISLKTQASMKGIKEKFDPLNVAKFLTAGSSLGPALLGKMMGRSGRDIEYFSGRLRPVRDTRMPAVLGRPLASSSSEGVNDMLRKIYYLMQSSRERDLRISNQEMNFAEERKLEADKRHKELLDALNSLVQNNEISMLQPSGGSLFGDVNLPTSLSKSKPGRGRAIIKNLFSSLTKVAVSFLSSPAFTIAAAPALLAVLAGNEKEAIDADPYNSKYDNNPYALSLRNKTTAGQEAKRSSAKALKQQGTARRGEIQDAVDSKLPDTQLREIYGADRETLKIWLSNLNNQLWIKGSSAAPMPAAENVPAPAAPAPQAAPAPSSTPTGVTMPAPGARSMATGSTTTPMAPARVTGTGLSARLGEANRDNLNLNLPSTKPQVNNVVNNLNAAQKAPLPLKVLNLKTVEVRNTEPTFMRMIMESTRVV